MKKIVYIGILVIVAIESFLVTYKIPELEVENKIVANGRPTSYQGTIE